MNAPLRTVVVGLRMGEGHVRACCELPELYRVVALCDLDEARAKEVAEKYQIPAIYTDYSTLLAQERPEVVAIATPNSSHAAYTLQAAEAGVRGICCEKPMAVNLKDARTMVQICAEHDTPLIINHQRRVGADLLAAHRLLDDGAIGQIRSIRGICGGDLLSDGTHLLDSMLWLAGDIDADWVFGQIHREVPPEEVGAEHSNAFTARAGFRFGHPVENGGMALVELHNGIRLELLTGDLREAGRFYQDYEVTGTCGRLWRSDDSNTPNLFIEDIHGGSWDARVNENWQFKPEPNADDAHGLWRPVDTEAPYNQITESYRRFADTIHHGADHPMGGAYALRGFEILMAIYESARLHAKVSLPLQQERFPLELMLEESPS